MAITTDLNPGRAVTRLKGHGIVVAGDRTQDFRRALRHSRLVRVLRLALPAASLAVIALYAGAVLKTTGWSSAVPNIAMPKIIPENLAMNNPRYEGFNPDGGSYVVTAKSASQNLKQPNLIALNDIDGNLFQADKTRTDLAAKRGLFDNAGHELQLFDGIDIVSQTGMKAKLKTATVLIKDSLVTSTDPVAVEMQQGRITSNAITLRHKLKEVTFTDSVVAHLLANTKPKPEGDAAATPKPGEPAKLFGSGDQPIDVTANRLDIKDNDKTATFTGNVRAAQGEATLHAPAMLVTYVGQAPGLPPMGKKADAKPADSLTSEVTPADAGASRVQRVVAQGPVIVTQKNGDRVDADNADFDASRQVAALSGNVVMSSLPDRRAQADRIDIDQKADTILMTGALVHVTQGRNELKGRRLFVDRKAGRSQLTSPGDLGGNGRVNARFYQNNAGKASATPATPAEPQQGAATALGATAFKTDPNAPIDIESNTLDVNDTAKNAVFRGDVQAVQGDVSMRTTEMTAFYSGQASLTDANRDPASRQQSAQLTRIEARRKVVVNSKSGQSATGDWADFDTKANTVTVGGDVVLTQGQNVVRGSKLVIDLTSGQSTLQTTPGAGWVAVSKTPGGAATPVDGGRPSAVFFPKQLKDGKAAAGKPATLSTKPPEQTPPAAQPQKPQGPNWDWAQDVERKLN